MSDWLHRGTRRQGTPPRLNDDSPLTELLIVFAAILAALFVALWIGSASAAECPMVFPAYEDFAAEMSPRGWTEIKPPREGLAAFLGIFNADEPVTYFVPEELRIWEKADHIGVFGLHNGCILVSEILLRRNFEIMLKGELGQ